MSYDPVVTYTAVSYELIVTYTAAPYHLVVTYTAVSYDQIVTYTAVSYVLTMLLLLATVFATGSLCRHIVVTFCSDMQYSTPMIAPVCTLT